METLKSKLTPPTRIKLRAVAVFSMFVLMYTNWKDTGHLATNATWGAIIGLIVAGIVYLLDRSVIKSPTLVANIRKRTKGQRYYENAFFGLLFVLFAWVWIENDIRTGSPGLIWHAIGLVMLVLGHFLRTGGLFDQQPPAKD